MNALARLRRMVAIDGSRFRAVNTHEKNYTKGKPARRKAHVEESIARYLAELVEADSTDTGVASLRIERLTERLASLRGRFGELEEIGRQLETAADGHLSLTDPDARAMATGSDHRGVVGYNLQAAVDTKQGFTLDGVPFIAIAVSGVRSGTAPPRPCAKALNARESYLARLGGPPAQRLLFGAAAAQIASPMRSDIVRLGTRYRDVTLLHPPDRGACDH